MTTEFVAFLLDASLFARYRGAKGARILRHVIGGESVESAATTHFVLINPATEEVYGQVPLRWTRSAARCAQAWRSQSLRRTTSRARTWNSAVQRLPSSSPAQTFRTADEALALAHGVRYALASSVWTSDYMRAMRFARDLDFGCVWINTHIPLRQRHDPRRLQALGLR